MSEDPIDGLMAELTALRRSVEHIARFSLSKQEAKDLNGTLTKAVGQMERAAQNAPRVLESTLAQDRAEIVDEIAQATTEATTRVLKDIRGQFDNERLRFAQAAGEARRAAWRSFGGFWVWVVALLATGAFLGLLAAHITETGRTLLRIKDMVRYGCDYSTVGGTVIEQDDGSSWCGFWIVDPDTAKYRREKAQGG